MGIKNEGAFKRSWFVITDRVCEFEEVTEDYNYPMSRYDLVAVGPQDWDTRSPCKATGFRISATRQELIELLRDFKEACPDANITVMKS